MAEAPSEDLRDVIPGVLRYVLVGYCDERQTKACMCSRYARKVHGNMLYALRPLPTGWECHRPKGRGRRGECQRVLDNDVSAPR